jgi:transketolase
MNNQKLNIPHHRTRDELIETSWRLSKDIINITTRAGSGHPSSSLSAIDIMTALYFGGIMQYDPKFSEWPQRDRFILSKGHAAPGLYVVLAEAGYFDPGLLSTLRESGSPLEGHPNRLRLPGVEASTGSLGQGLSIGLGHALAARVDDAAYRVYVLIGDGESDEGQVWEAAMSAAKYKTNNLTAILDYNGYQQTGSVEKVMPSLEPVKAKWTSFGWQVYEIDGHNMDEIMAVFKDVQQEKDRPQMVIAHTKKGKGLTPFEKDDVNRKHGETLSEDDARQALTELDKMYSSETGG